MPLAHVCGGASAYRRISAVASALVTSCAFANPVFVASGKSPQPGARSALALAIRFGSGLSVSVPAPDDDEDEAVIQPDHSSRLSPS